MKFYVVSDTHSFFTLLKDSLTKADFFTDQEPHKLVMLGDIFDRGPESKEMQEFVLDLLNRDEAILIRGNHDDMLVGLVEKYHGVLYTHHEHNGTLRTALDLTDIPYSDYTLNHPEELEKKLRATPVYQTIIPAMKDYFETQNHIFVHGWIPCVRESENEYSFIEQWREAGKEAWANARWYNGILAASQGVTEPGKTIVCGHFHASFGHAILDHKGPEFGPRADYSPYYAPGIIAIDACTAISGKVNCVVIEDEPMQ